MKLISFKKIKFKFNFLGFLLSKTIKIKNYARIYLY